MFLGENGMDQPTIQYVNAKNKSIVILFKTPAASKLERWQDEYQSTGNPLLNTFLKITVMFSYHSQYGGLQAVLIHLVRYILSGPVFATQPAVTATQQDAMMRSGQVARGGSPPNSNELAEDGSG